MSDFANGGYLTPVPREEWTTSAPCEQIVKYGRLPIEETRKLIAHLTEHGHDNAREDVYPVLWWLADNGWDVVKSRKP